MTAEEKLAPLLAGLRRTHDVLPFLERQLDAADAVFRRLPDGMVEVLATSPDFTGMGRGEGPVWVQLEGANGQAATFILACPHADGELWLIAPPAGARQDGSNPQESNSV